MGRIISFKGQVADEGQERIALQTNNGLVGYKINKFQVMPQDPSLATVKFVTKIYKVKQTTASIDDSVDFSDNTLIAAASYNEAPGGQDQAGYGVIIFDNEIFNQDIFITNFDAGAENHSINYYIELESMPLAIDEATVVTLKDIKNNKVPS